MPKGDRISKVTAIIENVSAIAATDEYFASTPTLSIAGTLLTPAQVKAVFQAELDALKAVEATRSLLFEQIATVTKARKKRQDLRRSLRAYILATFGPKAVAMLLAFKFAVPKPMGPKKIASKAKAVQAARATREARHTMGKRQKKAIKAAASASETK